MNASSCSSLPYIAQGQWLPSVCGQSEIPTGTSCLPRCEAGLQLSLQQSWYCTQDGSYVMALYPECEEQSFPESPTKDMLIIGLILLVLAVVTCLLILVLLVYTYKMNVRAATRTVRPKTDSPSSARVFQNRLASLATNYAEDEMQSACSTLRRAETRSNATSATQQTVVPRMPRDNTTTSCHCHGTTYNSACQRYFQLMSPATHSTTTEYSDQSNGNQLRSASFYVNTEDTFQPTPNYAPCHPRSFNNLTCKWRKAYTHTGQQFVVFCIEHGLFEGYHRQLWPFSRMDSVLLEQRAQSDNDEESDVGSDMCEISVEFSSESNYVPSSISSLVCDHRVFKTTKSNSDVVAQRHASAFYTPREDHPETELRPFLAEDRKERVGVCVNKSETPCTPSVSTVGPTSHGCVVGLGNSRWCQNWPITHGCLSRISTKTKRGQPLGGVDDGRAQSGNYPAENCKKETGLRPREEQNQGRLVNVGVNVASIP